MLEPVIEAPTEGGEAPISDLKEARAEGFGDAVLSDPPAEDRS